MTDIITGAAPDTAPNTTNATGNAAPSDGGTLRLPTDLGDELRRRREALGMSKSELAAKAGKVREVVYRLEAGEDTTVSSLLAVLAALGLAMRIERAGLPSAAEVARRFGDDDAS